MTTAVTTLALVTENAIMHVTLYAVPCLIVINGKPTIESFRSPFTLNDNGENVIKDHMILSTGNVYGEFLTYVTFRTTFYRARFSLSYFARQRIPFNVLGVYMFSSISSLSVNEV